MFAGDREASSRARARPRVDRASIRPVRLPAGLDVVDLRRDRPPRGDANELIDRLDEPRCLRSACARCTCRGAGRDLASATSSSVSAYVARRVDERRADAERAVLHRRSDESAHPLELAAWAAVLEPELVDADRRRADERRDVRRDPALLERVELLGQGRPVDVVLDVALRSRSRFFIASLTGPIDQPSPNTSSVTP